MLRVAIVALGFCVLQGSGQDKSGDTLEVDLRSIVRCMKERTCKTSPVPKLGEHPVMIPGVGFEDFSAAGLKYSFVYTGRYAWLHSDEAVLRITVRRVDPQDSATIILRVDDISVDGVVDLGMQGGEINDPLMPLTRDFPKYFRIEGSGSTLSEGERAAYFQRKYAELVALGRKHLL